MTRRLWGSTIANDDSTLDFLYLFKLLSRWFIRAIGTTFIISIFVTLCSIHLILSDSSFVWYLSAALTLHTLTHLSIKTWIGLEQLFSSAIIFTNAKMLLLLVRHRVVNKLLLILV